MGEGLVTIGSLNDTERLRLPSSCESATTAVEVEMEAELELEEDNDEDEDEEDDEEVGPSIGLMCSDNAGVSYTLPPLPSSSSKILEGTMLGTSRRIR